MEHAANPVSGSGERNVYCPFYDGCLDHAIEQAWRSWNCTKCKNQMIKVHLYQGDVLTRRSVEYGGLPQSILRLIE